MCTTLENKPELLYYSVTGRFRPWNGQSLHMLFASLRVSKGPDSIMHDPLLYGLSRKGSVRYG